MNCMDVGGWCGVVWCGEVFILAVRRSRGKTGSLIGFGGSIDLKMEMNETMMEGLICVLL